MGKGSRSAPTQTDIAKLAKVSQWAVSVTLNDRPEAQRVPEATRQRILTIADELGYVPNAAARNLRVGRNNLIGLLVYQKRLTLTDGSPNLAYLRGVERAAAAHKFDIVLFTSSLANPRLESDRASTRRSQNNRLHLADGTIVFGVESDLDELDRLSDEGYRFVYLGPRADRRGRPLAAVCPDYATGVGSVVAALAERGHRHLGFVASHPLDGAADPQSGRRRVFHEQLAAHGLPGGVEIAVDDLDRDWLSSQLENGLSGLVVTDEPALVPLRAIARAEGIDIPAQLSVGILEQVPGGPRPGVNWAYTPIPRERIGERAIEMLIELLDGPWPKPADLPAEWIPCDPLIGDTIVAAPGW